MSVSKMQRLTVFAFRKDAEAIIRKLMKLRCVEIRTADPERGNLILSHLNAEKQIAETEKRLNTVTESLPILAKYNTHKKGFARRVLYSDRTEFTASGADRKAFSVAEEALSVKNRMQEITTEESRLHALSESLLPWMEYDVPLNDTSSRKTVTVLGSFPKGTDGESLFASLEEAGIAPEEVYADEHGIYAALTYLAAEETEVNILLSSHAFLKAEFPEEAEGTAQKIANDAEKSLETLDAEYVRLEERLRDLADEKEQVELLSDVVETTLITERLKQRLAETGHCAILDGWIPYSMRDIVSEALDRFECAYELEDPAPEDDVPVLLSNNRFAANFEWVVGMYSYPRYGTFDPTFIMSIFYFIIFGLMFADAGYGLLLTICAFGGIKLLNPRAGMKRMLSMFGYCGISSAIMGVIFGGWFGDLPTAIMSNMLGLPIDTSVGHFFSSGLWLNPLDDPMTFLILSLGVGAVHLITGMAVKFILLCQDGQAGEAICTILPYWVLFAGLGLFLVDGTIALYVTLAGALLILLLNGYGQKNVFQRLIKGFGGLYGLISYGSDLLSYSRILALGMVAGVVAKVINMITALGSTGVIGFLLMLIILVAGHVLNIGINILGTFVHAARLQYIEFFGKFYEDGGTPFDPALPAEQYSEDLTDSTH